MLEMYSSLKPLMHHSLSSEIPGVYYHACLILPQFSVCDLLKLRYICDQTMKFEGVKPGMWLSIKQATVSN